jgi:hypothetical protein
MSTFACMHIYNFYLYSRTIINILFYKCQAEHKLTGNEQVFQVGVLEVLDNITKTQVIIASYIIYKHIYYSLQRNKKIFELNSNGITVFRSEQYKPLILNIELQ